MSRSGVRRRIAVLLAALALDAIAGDQPNRLPLKTPEDHDLLVGGLREALHAG